MHRGRARGVIMAARMSALDDPQLRLAVDRPVSLTVVEHRGGEVRELRVGPIGEADARLLAALLLGRSAVSEDDGGPWRGAVAGGSRTVALEQA